MGLGEESKRHPPGYEGARYQAVKAQEEKREEERKEKKKRKKEEKKKGKKGLVCFPWR
jgi:phage head maturation protease